jgi:hypothetical protein
MREEPSFPRQGDRLVKFMYKIEKQTPVLPVEILDAETTLLLRQNNLIPDG